MRCVYIPIRDSQENVEVVLDELPEDVDDILNILKAEQAPLDLWLIIAKEYFRQQKIEQFLQILEEGSGPETAVYYPEPEVKYDRIAILNARGAYYSYLGKAETRRSVKEKHFLEASKCYNTASTIDLHEPSTWIGKGQLLLAKGDLDQSYDAFSLALERDRNNVVALVGLASVQFARGRYADSLNIYKKCLRTYPDAPGVRLGYAFCHFKLGNSDKAQRAFQRVLQVDPDNIEALIVAGACEVQTGQADGIRNGMEKMKRAFDIYPYCSTTLNCLANHFFMTGQHFLVEQLSESALLATKDGLTMAHSYYNVGRSYLAKENYERAGVFYMKSVKKVDDPKDFVLPFYGLGQVQMKLGDLQSASVNFEKVLEVQPGNPETLKALGYIYAQLGKNDRALELYTKATKADPHDPEAFMDLAELLVTKDTAAALNAFITARDLLKKRNKEVTFELLNNIGALHSEKGDFELAANALKEALGDGIWCYLVPSEDEAIPDLNKISRENYFLDVNVNIHNPDKPEVFSQLERQGVALELPSDKVTTLFNYARTLEQTHQTEAATTLYHLILFKYPKYTDAKLRLAAIAKSRRQFKKSREMLVDVLKTDKNCTDALLMLGDLELKADYWVQAKETFREAKNSSDEKDAFAAISLGNWNYYAALRSENRAPRLEATHYEKAKELYTNVLVQNPHNLYAANGAGLVFAERGKFDIAKDLFLEAQEAASGRSNARIPDIWINLAHTHYGLGDTAMAIKMYENCSHKFYYNTDSQVLLYIARVHYDVEKWNESRRALLRAIHLDPSNQKFRFNAGLVMQKFSSLTLQKDKKTLIEVRASVSELKNAVRVFSLLSSGPRFEEKKIKPHLDYCNHLLEASSVHCEVAEREEERNKQRQEIIRKLNLADQSQKKAEEQRKIQMEKRKQEEDRRLVMEEEKRLARLKEQWKTSKRRRKSKKKDADEEEGAIVTRRRKREEKKEKKKKDDKGKKIAEETEANTVDKEDADANANANKTKRRRLKKKSGCDAKLLNVLDEVLAATGLKDTDDEENAVTGLGNSNVKEEENAANPLMIPRRRAVSDSEDEDKPAAK